MATVMTVEIASMDTALNSLFTLRLSFKDREGAAYRLNEPSGGRRPAGAVWCEPAFDVQRLSNMDRSDGLVARRPTHWPNRTGIRRTARFLTRATARDTLVWGTKGEDRIVEVAAGDVGGQVLAAGLIGEVRMDVVPVVFGSGKRFSGSVQAQHLLENPDVVIQGDRVLHLRSRVSR